MKKIIEKIFRRQEIEESEVRKHVRKIIAQLDKESVHWPELP